MLANHWCIYMICMPTFLAGLMQVHVHIKRHLMKELPEDEDAVAQWCKDLFVAKVVAVEITSQFTY